MTETCEMSADVLAAINSNRKIEAIKLLREERRIGLKEAKEIVDQHIEAQPPGPRDLTGRADTGVGRIVLVCGVLIAAYVAYRMLA